MQSIMKISIEEYFIQEAKIKHKSEYYRGEIIAMARASDIIPLFQIW